MICEAMSYSRYEKLKLFYFHLKIKEIKTIQVKRTCCITSLVYKG
jgi:hypothetical protein